MATKEQVLKELSNLSNPKKPSANIVESGMIESVEVSGANAVITLQIDPDDAEVMEPVRQRCEEAALSVAGIDKARAIMTAKRNGAAPSGAPSSAPTPPPKPQPLKGVKTIIAVASGKGGVGKSTTAVNVAFALKNMGYKVGLVDCDVYGPSASLLMGVETGPKFTDDDRIMPIDCDGVKAISMAFLIDRDTAAVWRGPMVISAIQQFFNGVAWDIDGPLDFLIADLPPGTGDVQLTMAQTVNVHGALIVSTPQDLALIDARKAYDMFLKTGTRVLGVVENMSYFNCPHCGERSDIFGHGGARETAKEKNIPFLGEIPLHMDIRHSADNGKPVVQNDPESAHAKAYMEITKRALGELVK